MAETMHEIRCLNDTPNSADRQELVSAGFTPSGENDAAAKYEVSYHITIACCSLWWITGISLADK